MARVGAWRGERGRNDHACCHGANSVTAMAKLSEPVMCACARAGRGEAGAAGRTGWVGGLACPMASSVSRAGCSTRHRAARGRAVLPQPEQLATRVDSAADGAIAASARGGTSSAAFAARCCALLPTTFAALASCSSPAACTASRAEVRCWRAMLVAASSAPRRGNHSITTLSSLTRHSRFPSADQSKPARRSSASTALPGLLFQLTPLRSSISSTLVSE